MRLRPFIMFVIIIVNLVLQSTVFSYFEVLSIKPNTAILIIVSYAILRGDIEGSIFGFFTGLMQDIFFGKVIGFYALMGALLGFACGKPFKNFFKDSYWMPLILSAMSTIAYEIIFYITNFLFRVRFDINYYFQIIIIPGLIYTVFLSVIVYQILYKINAKLEQVEKDKRKLFD